MLYKFWNKSNVDAILAEAKTILTNAREAAKLEAMCDDDFKWANVDIPLMGIS